MNDQIATTKTRTIKLGVSNMPTEVQVGLRVASNRRRVKLVVVSDDAYKVYFSDVRWGGGSRNEYYSAPFGQIPTRLNPAEGTTGAIEPGSFLIVGGFFCGQEFDPAVYVREADLCEFLGMGKPPAPNMPAALAAEYMAEEAAKLPARARRKIEKTAGVVRQIMGVA